MIELNTSHYTSARHLFNDQEHHLLVTALFEGNLEAHLFVDDVTRPRAGLIAYHNRFLFGGDPDLEHFNADLRHYFAETVIPTCKAAGSDAFLCYFSPDDWKTTLEALFSAEKIFHGPRQYYETENPDPTPEISLPKGFSLHRVTAELLTSGLQGMEALTEEMCSERTSAEDFLAHSFGLCPVYENTIAGWCLSEYNTGQRCEIGIATLEPHQRQGIATTLTKAFLAEAAQRGYTRIGWDCWARNVPSAATARKAGFKLVKEYPALVVVLQ